MNGGMGRTMKSDEWVGRNRDLFLEMKELALRQREVVTADRIDLFRDLAARRERIRQKISLNDNRRRRGAGPSPDPAAREKIRSLSEEISGIIKSIQDIDRDIETSLSRGRTELLREISDLRQGRKALKGYGMKAARVPRFIDKQG